MSFRHQWVRALALRDFIITIYLCCELSSQHTFYGCRLRTAQTQFACAQTIYEYLCCCITTCYVPQLPSLNFSLSGLQAFVKQAPIVSTHHEMMKNHIRANHETSIWIKRKATEGKMLKIDFGYSFLLPFNEKQLLLFLSLTKWMIKHNKRERNHQISSVFGGLTEKPRKINREKSFTHTDEKLPNCL